MQIGPNGFGVRLAARILHVKVILLGRQSYSNYHRSAMYLQRITQILLRLT